MGAFQLILRAWEPSGSSLGKYTRREKKKRDVTVFIDLNVIWAFVLMSCPHGHPHILLNLSDLVLLLQSKKCIKISSKPYASPLSVPPV